MARAGNIWNWNSHRVDRRAGLLPVAAARRATCQSSLASARELFMYASKIKETTNGSRSCPCREAWQKVEVVAKRRVAPNGQLDERKRATQNGEDKAQGKAHAQTHEKLEVVFAVQTVAPAEDSTCGNQAEEPAYKKDIGRQKRHSPM